VIPRAALALLAAALAGCQSPAIAPVDPPAVSTFDAALVARGASLAAIGNCGGCHTRRGGAAFAGGFPMHSPFGTIYSTNITPDRETGIGRWSEEAFRRAMREGIRNDGAHLYPAFPYDRFTRTTDADIRAIYAYLMSLPAVRYEPPPNALVFPFNVRAGIAVWKRLHFREGRGPPSPMRVEGALLARGEYLVEGLGHCGSCHSPRTRLFGEDVKRLYDGGDAEGWHAYAINEKIAAPIPWNAQALAFYLRRGYHADHGIARGTMGIVTAELARADEGDVRAMAAYVEALMGASRARGAVRRAASVAGEGEGARIYRSLCLPCHDGRAALPFGGVELDLSLGVHGESPRNLVNVVLHGLPPAEGKTTPMMPGYAGALDDAQVEALVQWLRANLAGKPHWSDVRRLIAESRRMTPERLLFEPGGAGSAP
jgi:mono/diheme cytochrome c family protein